MKNLAMAGWRDMDRSRTDAMAEVLRFDDTDARLRGVREGGGEGVSGVREGGREGGGRYRRAYLCHNMLVYSTNLKREV